MPPSMPSLDLSFHDETTLNLLPTFLFTFFVVPFPGRTYLAHRERKCCGWKRPFPWISFAKVYPLSSSCFWNMHEHSNLRSDQITNTYIVWYKDSFLSTTLRNHLWTSLRLWWIRMLRVSWWATGWWKKSLSNCNSDGTCITCKFFIFLSLTRIMIVLRSSRKKPII